MGSKAVAIGLVVVGVVVVLVWYFVLRTACPALPASMTAAPSVPGYCGVANVNSIANEIDSVPAWDDGGKLSAPGQCVAKCESVPGCTGFTYMTAAGDTPSCYMKTWNHRNTFARPGGFIYAKQ